MQPYQMASESIRQHGEIPSQLGSFAIGLGSGLAASRVIPFLSSFIPAKTAIKGLEKIDPRFGKFIKGAMGTGATFDQIRQFISDKISKEEPKKAQDTRNVIEQYSPDLFSFLKEQISTGRSPIEAGALAQLPKSKFLNTIKKIEEDHKTPWSSILQSVFGDESKAALQEPKVASQQQPHAMGTGQQALMQMIQQINAKLG